MHPRIYLLIFGIGILSCHSSPEQNSSDASFFTDSVIENKGFRPAVSPGKWYYSLEEALKEPDSVRYLSLREYGYKQFPTEILQFSNLEKLDIGLNEFSDFPEEISQLQRLRSLRCSYGQLTTLPAGIGELQQLELLWLLANDLKTLPEEIGQLKNLRELNLTLNPIETLPESFFQLKNLRRLSFQTPDYGQVFTPERQKEIRERLPLCHIDFGEDE